ncbi:MULTISPECIES: hypothetical protein [unclassified Caulobacter]|uniref:hypothetical protein n=1 Tax=unclassified Caulobacter TaxID=2648921 RepID=UPI000AB57E20|nr:MULTISPECIES: hypothetical protein [unclassified Caulobacter]
MLKPVLALAVVALALAACGGRPYPPYRGPSAPVAPNPNKVTPPPPPIDVIRPKIP